MNATNVLKLDKWIRDNKGRIQLAKKTQKMLADQASTELDCKVSVSTLRDVMIANGMETRQKSKHEREAESMRAEIDNLRDILLKVVTTTSVPDWLREELLTNDLNEEIKSAIRKTG